MALAQTLRYMKAPVSYLGFGLHQGRGQEFGRQVGGEQTRPGTSKLRKEFAKGDLLYPRHAGPVGEVVDRPQVALTENKAQHLLHPCGTCRTRGRGQEWGR